MSILLAVLIGFILRWYVIRRMRKFIREEVNSAIVGAASARAIDNASFLKR